MLNKRSLLSQFLHFSAATVASLMVFSLYSIVDGLFVAKGSRKISTRAVITRPMTTSTARFWENRLLAFSRLPWPR